MLCKGHGLPENLPGILPGVTGAPDPATCFPGGVVDPVAEPGAESLGVCI